MVSETILWLSRFKVEVQHLYNTSSLSSDYADCMKQPQQHHFCVSAPLQLSGGKACLKDISTYAPFIYIGYVLIAILKICDRKVSINFYLPIFLDFDAFEDTLLIIATGTMTKQKNTQVCCVKLIWTSMIIFKVMQCKRFSPSGWSSS